MSVETRHPEYQDKAADYRLMRDSFAGERRIKEATFLYLPPTPGQIKDGALRSVTSPGWVSYQNYLVRAQFPEFVREAVHTLVGVMHSEPAIIELPEELEPLRKRATREGESLQMLLRRINEQQLLYGRIGLLVDFPQEGREAELAQTPHLVTYEAETFINWDDERFTEYGTNKLSFGVFNETVFVRGADGVNIYDWQEERRFRVVLLEPVDPEQPESFSNPSVYKTFVENDDVRSDTIIPRFFGRMMEEIPFTVIGANDLNIQPDDIPLLSLANLCVSIYRSEADYRQALHMQGQDTLVIIGDELSASGDAKDEDEATEVGAGAIIRIAAGEGAKAEFIGVESRGIPEQRSAIESDKGRAQSMGARLLEPRGSQAESGEALRIRVAASTASLASVAITGAAGLEQALKQAARWVGADENKVRVRPNVDFTQETPAPEMARQLGEAVKTGNIPLSKRSIHAWLQARNYTKLTYEEEQEEMAAERAREAAFESAERVVGRTAEVDGHAHNYVLLRFPDGSVHGITDYADGHFHIISQPDVTDETNDHTHQLMEGTALPQPTDPGQSDDPEAEGDQPEEPSETDPPSSDDQE